MVFQREAVLATLPGPMQQPNDKYEENKSTPSQIPEQICIKKKKEEIHTFGATTKQQLQY